MTTKVLTNRDIRNFWDGLQMLSQAGEHPVKFAYAISRNRAKLRRIIESLNESMKPVEGFDEKRIELAKEMAKKDDKGDPILMADQKSYLVPDMAAFDRKLEELKRSMEQDKREKDIEKLLDMKEELDVYMIPFATLPEKMRPDILEAILPMVDDIPPDEDPK